MCLDRTSGRIYISRDVVFDESVFPYSSPGVSVDIASIEHALTFPSNEPVSDVHVRKYDLSYLSPDLFSADAALISSKEPVATLHPP